jgi:hypothetical protein
MKIVDRVIRCVVLNKLDGAAEKALSMGEPLVRRGLFVARTKIVASLRLA